jgi:beta-phosphoglucomutase-like phosphatase (HAD superfamily)
VSRFLPVTHVLFDMDGLLLDTEELYSTAYQAVMDKSGSTSRYTFDYKVRHIMGRRPNECAVKMIEHYGLEMTPDEFLVGLGAEQENLFPKSTWMPGILKFLHHLYKVETIGQQLCYLYDCDQHASFV